MAKSSATAPVKKESFGFKLVSDDGDAVTLKLHKSGDPLSKILKSKKNYYSIQVSAGKSFQYRIGVHSDLEGKYALSFHDEKNKHSSKSDVADACKVRWKKFHTERTTIASVNRAIAKILLLSNFK